MQGGSLQPPASFTEFHSEILGPYYNTPFFAPPLGKSWLRALLYYFYYELTCISLSSYCIIIILVFYYPCILLSMYCINLVLDYLFIVFSM